MPLLHQIQSYKHLETLAHVTLDDIIIKAMQELFEMFEAKNNQNFVELEKETCDTIVNILSASIDMGVIPRMEHISNTLEVQDMELLMKMKAWSEGIQAMRKRYSRKSIFQEELTSITEDVISHVLSYGVTKKTLNEIIETNTKKLSKRINDYTPRIDLKKYVKEYANFPKEHVLFKDISPLLMSPEVMEYLCFELAEKARGAEIVAGLDARGFLFGPMVAKMLQLPFVMIRKSGKLPGEVEHQDFEKEYGIDTLEIQKNTVLKGKKVALLDDLLATGGTMDAAAQLIEKSDGIVHKIIAVAQINDPFCFAKREEYELSRYEIDSVLHYEK